MNSVKTLCSAMLVVGTVVSSSSALALSRTPEPERPTIADDGMQPPSNPYLANSAWPISHAGSYQQGSSPYLGPLSEADLADVDYRIGGLTNITLAMSPEYDNGQQVYWGSSFGSVYKMTAGTSNMQRVARAIKGNGPGIDNLKTATSGAYTFVDHNNEFYTVSSASILVYRDADNNNPDSAIIEDRTFDIPAEYLRGTPSDDPIVGMNLTYDGFITFATKNGTIGIVSRDFSQQAFLQLGDESGEEISNSIAVDEDGGIYVVSAKQMYRAQWNGSQLSIDEADGGWSAPYEEGADTSGAGRLGAGSGSTPSLMGTGDMDKFVVITDGQEQAHLVLFWRDEIPADWQPIAPGKSRRIAAEVPINYGDVNRTATMSEQSVLVRGYGAVVVSNDYRNADLLSGLSTGNDIFNTITNGITVFFSKLGFVRPYGVQKFEWNPDNRSIDTAWVNNDISCPNGIPTMSAQSQLFYCVGARGINWTIEALDWNTGELAFSKALGSLPGRFNSFYAATQIVNNQGIASGTAYGVMELEK